MTTNEQVLNALKRHNVELFDGWERVKRIRTGSIAFDNILGGGLPIGRITQVYGAESVGKSTFCYLTAASITQNKQYVFWVDSEGSHDPDWAITLGVDLDYLHIYRPKFAETAFEIIISMMNEGVYNLIIIDSIVGFAFRAVVEAGFDKVPMGGRARAIGTFLSIVRNKLVDSDTAMLLCNQVRANLKPYGGDTMRPGGKQLEHDSDIIVNMLTPVVAPPDPSPSNPIKTITLRPKIKKNRTAPRRGFSAEVVLHVQEEQVVSRTTDVVALGRELGIFTNKDGDPLRGAAKPHYNGVDLVYDGEGADKIVGTGSTDAKVRVYLSMHPELEDEIYDEIQTRIGGPTHEAQSS